MKGRTWITEGFAVLVSLGMSVSAWAAPILRMRGGDVSLTDASAGILAQSTKGATQTRYFVVQLGGAISEADRADLAAAGLEAIRYLPDHALLVRGTAEMAGLAGARNAGIVAVVPFAAAWKYDASLLDTRDPLLVTLIDARDAVRVSRELRRLPGVQVVGESETDLIVTARPESVSRIAEVEGVEWIDSVPLFTSFLLPMDEQDRASGAKSLDGTPAYTGYETGTKLMGFEAAWQRGFTGQGEIAAIGDTGVDSGVLSTLHPDLRRVKGGYAVGTGSRSWEDPQGHGTHVAGSVVSDGTQSAGRIRGGAYDADFYAVGLWSPLLNNLVFPNDFAKITGVTYGVGVRVHSNSWGNPRAFGVYDAFARKADEYLWSEPDMLILFAAGNSGEDKDADGHIDTGSVTSPSTAKNVLTVGASENLLAEGGIQKMLKELRDGTKKWGAEPIASDRLSDNPQGIAAFSSRGPTTDGRIKPEIVAPGTNIVSTRSRHPKAEPLWGAYGNDYAYAGGTSMATPLTAGAAAVTRQYIRRELGVANPSAALVKATLIHSAFDLFPGQYGEGAGREFETRRPNVHEGYGRVDMDALTQLGQGTEVADERTGLGTGESRTYGAVVKAGGSLRATLVYTDAPGSISAARALVNNLDLVVVGPAGEVTTKSDAVNNTEMLELANLPAGQYQVMVKGMSIPMGRSGKQPYALVVSAQ